MFELKKDRMWFSELSSFFFLELVKIYKVLTQKYMYEVQHSSSQHFALQIFVMEKPPKCLVFSRLCPARDSDLGLDCHLWTIPVEVGRHPFRTAVRMEHINV